jgi:hypothetical protein
MCIGYAAVALPLAVANIVRGFDPLVISVLLVCGVSGAVVGIYGLVSRRPLNQLPTPIQIMYALVVLGLIIAGLILAFLLYLMLIWN